MVKASQRGQVARKRFVAKTRFVGAHGFQSTSVISPLNLLGLDATATQNLSQHGDSNAVPGHAPFHSHSWRWGALRIALVFLAASLTSTCHTNSAAQFPTEYERKAAFLFNFMKFVEWPDDGSALSHGEWIIGVAGDNPISVALARLTDGKNVQGHELHVKTFQSVDEMRQCNLLYISSSEKKRLPSILAALRGANVLTVADMGDFIDSGGMVQFADENDHVRITIDVEVVGRAKLKISSKLLSVASVVHGADWRPSK